MTNKRGTVKLFTFSFEIDAPNIISCAPKIFGSAPKTLHLVAQVLPNSNLNFEPWCNNSQYVKIGTYFSWVFGARKLQSQKIEPTAHQTYKVVVPKG